MQQAENHITDEHIKALIEKYGVLLFRISYCLVCNKDDAEDAVQETFLKYLTKSPEFADEEHEKAWLLRVVANISKNMVLLRLKRNTICIEDLSDIGVEDKDYGLFELIMGLPSKYKLVLTLYYVEGYKTKEISDILDVSEGYLLNGASSSSENYLDKEFTDLIKSVSPEKQKLIYNVAKTIAETDMNEE